MKSAIWPTATMRWSWSMIRMQPASSAPAAAVRTKYRGVMGRIDILTGTLGKALGGASGGFVSARKEIVAWLRQRSRPYLFSNSIAPAVAAATLRVLDLLEQLPSCAIELHANARYFRERMQALGFDLVPGEHPIIPVMLGDAPLAVRLAERMQNEGIYVVAFAFPVVPHGKARIRTQMNAAHSTAATRSGGFCICPFGARPRHH